MSKPRYHDFRRNQRSRSRELTTIRRPPVEYVNPRPIHQPHGRQDDYSWLPAVIILGIVLLPLLVVALPFICLAIALREEGR